MTEIDQIRARLLAGTHPERYLSDLIRLAGLESGVIGRAADKPN